MGNFETYYAYLKNRSKLGLLYRRHCLYPRLCVYLRGRVLDVGCGIGDFVAFRPETVGVDINPETVAWCGDNGLDVRLMEGNLLPFADCEFDSVIMDNVLEHIPFPGPLLGEIARVMAPGASLVVGVPGRCGYDSDPDHKIFYGEASLIAVVNAAGFAQSRLIYAPIRSEWLDRYMRQYCLYGVFHRL